MFFCMILYKAHTVKSALPCLQCTLSSLVVCLFQSHKILCDCNLLGVFSAQCRNSYSLLSSVVITLHLGLVVSGPVLNIGLLYQSPKLTYLSKVASSFIDSWTHIESIKYKDVKADLNLLNICCKSKFLQQIILFNKKDLELFFLIRCFLLIHYAIYFEITCLVSVSLERYYIA